MKKTLARKRQKTGQEELASEYRFNYGEAKPNRFVRRMSGGAIRSIISSVPKSKRKKTYR
jgi:hypothetical protein